MSRNSPVPVWASMRVATSSDDEIGSSEVEEDQLRRSTSIPSKRKGKSPPLARAGPKRQRTADGNIVAPSSSSLSTKLPRLSGDTQALAGPSKAINSRPRASEPGSTRASASNPIPGPSTQSSSTATSTTTLRRSKSPRPLRVFEHRARAFARDTISRPSTTKPSSTAAAPPLLRRSKSPRPLQLLKPVEKFTRKRSLGRPAPRSRSSSGPTRVPAKESEIIDLTSDGETKVPPAKPVAKSRTSGHGPPSSIRIPPKVRNRPEQNPPKGAAPPAGVEVVIIDDSDEEAPPAPKPSSSRPVTAPKALPKVKARDVRPPEASDGPTPSTRPASKSSSKPIALPKRPPSTNSSSTSSDAPTPSTRPASKPSSKPIALPKRPPSTNSDSTPSASQPSSKPAATSKPIASSSQSKHSGSEKRSAASSPGTSSTTPNGVIRTTGAGENIVASKKKGSPQPRPPSRVDDDPDKMDVDTPDESLQHPTASFHSPKSSINTPSAAPAASHSTPGPSVTISPLTTTDPKLTSIDFKSLNKVPLPERSRPNISQTPVMDNAEPRPPVISVKEGAARSQVSPPANPRKSSGLDMSGLKDVLADTVGLSRRTPPSQADKPFTSSRPPSAKGSHPAPEVLQRGEPPKSSSVSPRVAHTMPDLTPYQDPKGKGEDLSVSSRPLAQRNTIASPPQFTLPEGDPNFIDLTLDSDEDMAPPPDAHLADALQSSRVLQSSLVKAEPPMSPPSLTRNKSRVTSESDPEVSKNVSPSDNATGVAHDDPPARFTPMRLPLPKPRSLMVLQDLNDNLAAAPAKTTIEDASSAKSLPHPSRSPRSPDFKGPTSDSATEDSQTRGSEGSSSSSPSDSPPPPVSLPHRTARKSGRGRFRGPGHSTYSNPLFNHVPPAPTSTTCTSEAGSVPPSSSQPPVDTTHSSPGAVHATSPIDVPQTSDAMEGVIEDEALAPEVKDALPESDESATNRQPILGNAYQEPTLPTPVTGAVSGPVLSNKNAPATVPTAALDYDSELEYVDEPIVTGPSRGDNRRIIPEPLTLEPGPPCPEVSNEVDASEMEVEALLLPSARNSPVPVPEEDAQKDAFEAMGDPLDILDDVACQPRRSTRSSRSASDEPLDFFGEDSFNDSASSPPTSPTPPERPSSPAPIKIFGGFESLNWRTYRQNPENFKPRCHFGRDLPHTLQDTINSFTDAGRRHRSLASIMEATIRENTAEDEPDAPPIEIINEVDDDPTPPWEFHYSNKMWLGDDVPLPDVANLVHCNCVGRCDPKSKTCACAQRQHQWLKDSVPTPDFMYDNKGHVKSSVYPVFECNDLCGCGDECRNRVVQHGRKCAVRIQKTQEKGWGLYQFVKLYTIVIDSICASGVFAGPKKILAGSFIGIYAGELLTDRVGELRGITYNKFGRTYLFDLDFWYLREGNENWDIQYTVDAYHAGNKPLLTVFAKRDIEPFEELCFSYSGDSGDASDDEGDKDRRSSPAGDKDAVYVKCACKAYNCTGYMFK
ncbi:hypothetical protein DXG01_011535 [Tephrocybe rancida]|nr:hypothetical protein DXG01_011535 [Tephrocybe rancida]